MSFAGAFLLAAAGRVDPQLLLATASGVALAIASACIANNLIDRDIDARMARTARRGLVTGAVSASAALALCVLGGAAGFALLAAYSGWLVVAIVLAGYLNYVVAYSLYWKRHSVHATLVGSLSGATAPVAGYCAVSGRFDREAVLLMLVFALWQMPHAYAIAVARLHDYRAAGIPVLPACRGVALTRRHMLAYMAAFLAAALCLPLLHYAGWVYAAVVAVLGGYWLRLGWGGSRAGDERAWARAVFAFSLVVVMAVSVMMAIDYRPVSAAATARALVSAQG